VHSHIELTILEERIADMVRYAEQQRGVRAARPTRRRHFGIFRRPQLARRPRPARLRSSEAAR
jgi:hypothetical protein